MVGSFKYFAIYKTNDNIVIDSDMGIWFYQLLYLEHLLLVAGV